MIHRVFFLPNFFPAWNGHIKNLGCEPGPTHGMAEMHQKKQRTSKNWWLYDVLEFMEMDLLGKVGYKKRSSWVGPFTSPGNLLETLDGQMLL